MFFRKKIPCYVIVYDEISVIKPSLQFITKFAKKLEIIIIENKSDNTPKIKKMINRLGKKGLVDRYYLFDKNIAGRAFEEVFMLEKKLINRSPLVLVTDGDLSCTDVNWLDEQKFILKKHREVFACAVDLDTSNLPIDIYPSAESWVPKPTHIFNDFSEGFTGIHLLLMRGRQLIKFLDWKKLNKKERFHDSYLHQYCQDVMRMKWARTNKAKAYHYTWDLYRDKKHPYTQFKRNGGATNARKKSMDLSVSYTLTVFD